MSAFLRSGLLRGVGIVGSLLLFTPVHGQENSARTWNPTRPVTLTVPYAPGGGTDAAARAIAQGLTRVWGQSVVVENVPGAEGLIGTRRVMEAKPDGYRIVIEVPSITLVRFQPSLKVDDPLSNLQPITSIADAPPAFVATTKVPAKTMGELVQYCKTAPTPCAFGTGENSAKFQARKFGAENGIDNLIVVNYKGSGAMIPDLIAGNVTIAYTGVAAALPLHRAGSVRMLSTASPKRSPASPDVPTVREAGMPSFESVTWYGLFAPKGTPKDIVNSIADAVREAGRDPAVQQALKVAGAVPVMNTPEQFAEQVAEVQTRYSELARRFPLF